MEYKDYYAALGLPRTASPTEIKKAFRKLAREHHPDTKPGDAAAERRFKEVNEAHAVLSDPEKRSHYDRLGADWEAYSRAGATAAAGRRGSAAGDPFAGFGGTGGGGGNVRYEFRTSGDTGGFSDFFRVFFAGDAEATGGSANGPGRGRRPTGGPSFEEILAGMGLRADGTTPTGGTPGARTTAASPRNTPAAAEAVAEITLDEAYHGTTRLIDIDGKRLEVTIPPGADTGTRIRLSGKAPGGGDIHVVVRQLPDPEFTRRGADLERELPLTLEEALLGADVPVPTPKGTVLLRIPPGTQNGRTFRLTGRGLPRFRKDGHGDVFARARIVLPTDLDEEAIAAARRLFDLIPRSDPRSGAGSRTQERT